METPNTKPLLDILDRIDQAGARVRQTLEERPSSFLAAAVGSGIVAGIILRHERTESLQRPSRDRPLALFGAAVIAGYALAPYVLGGQGPGGKAMRNAHDVSEVTPSKYDDFQEVS